MRLTFFRTSVLVFLSLMLMAASCGGDDVTPPTSLKDPTNFTAKIVSETRVDLSWTAVSDATGYSLERKPEGGNYSVIATLGKTATSHSDTVEAGKTYTYRIFSLRNSEKSKGAESSKVTLPLPGQPFNLTDLEPIWFSKQPRDGNPSSEATAPNAVSESGTSLTFTGNAEALYAVAGLCTKFSASVSGSGKVFADETQLWSGTGATGDLPLIGKQQLSLVSSGNATWTNVVVTCSAKPDAPNSAYIGGKWGEVFKWGTSPTGLVATHAANLPDGRVISFSAWKELAFGLQNNTYIDRTDGYVWDPENGTGPNSFIQADAGNTNQSDDNPTDHDMFCAGLAMLSDGRLFAGGGGSFNSSGGAPAISQFKTSYFDFRTSLWSAGNDINMREAHWYGTAVAMPDNRVFMVGGGSGSDTAEILNSSGTTWTQFTDNVSGLFPTQSDIDIEDTTINYNGDVRKVEEWELAEVQQWYPYLNIAPDGKLFQSGPFPKLRNITVNASSLAIANAGTIPASHAKMRTWGNYVMFDEGKILVTGGSIVRGHDATNTAMIVDISGGGVDVQINVPNMRFRRSFQNSVVLPTGDVLIIGGNNSGKQMADQGFADAPESNPVDAKKRWPSDISTQTVYTPEVYSPDKNTWRDLTDMTVPRNYHSVALLLEDGRVLAAGGGLCGDTCATNHPNGQIYEPSYLFNPNGSPANRPIIGSLSASSDANGVAGAYEINTGQTFNVTMTGLGDGTDITKFTMIKLSAVTHGINTDLRYFEFSEARDQAEGRTQFEQISATSYKLTTTSNKNVLTPGYYFLFALNNKGVPSVAKVVQVL
jgi:hypothetical protein